MDADVKSIKKWIVFYPIYINSKKTIAEGRRIGVNKACENPTCVEISDCCNYLKLPSAIEIDKAYPRFYAKRKSEGSVEKRGRKSNQSKHFF